MSLFGPAARRPSAPALVRTSGHSLEDRVVPTVTLFVDFGDGYGANGITIQAGQLAAAVTAGGLGGPDLGFNATEPLTFIGASQSIVGIIDYNRDGTRDQTDYTDFRRDTFALVQRYYAPYNINVVLSSASSAGEILGELTANNSRPQNTGIFDTHAFFATVLDSTGFSAGGGLFGIAGVDTQFGTAYPGPPANDSDNSTLTFSDSILSAVPTGQEWQASLRAARTIAHEAGHSFGLYHLEPTDPVVYSELIPSGAVDDINRINFAFAGRYNFPLAVSEGGSGLTENPYDVFAAFMTSNIGARSDAALLGTANTTGLGQFFISGTGVRDTISIVANGGTITVTVSPTGKAAYSYTIPNNGQGLRIETSIGDDVVTLTGDIRGRVSFFGGAGTDTIIINAAGGAASFTPGGDIPISLDQNPNVYGKLVVGNMTLDYQELRAASGIFLTNVSSLDLNLTGGTDSVGLGVDANGRVRLTGSLNGLAPPNFSFADVGLLNINMGDGDDTFTSGAIRNARLGAVSINGGGGIDTVSITEDTNFSVAGNQVTPLGAVPISAFVEQLNVTGGASDNAFTVVGYPGSIKIDGLGGNDILNVIGTALPESVVLNGGLLTLGATTLTAVGIETAVVDAGGGDDTITVATSLSLGSTVTGLRGGGGTDTLVVPASGATNVAIDLGLGALGSGISGVGARIAFDGIETTQIFGGGSLGLTVRDFSNQAIGSPADPLAGVIFRATSGSSGDLRFGTASGLPAVVMSGIGVFSYDGDANRSGARDTLTVLGTSDGRGARSAFGEISYGGGSDEILVDENRVAVTASGVPLLRANYVTAGLRAVNVRGGDEQGPGDRFQAAVSKNLTVIINGGDPTSTPGDNLTVLTLSALNPFAVNDPTNLGAATTQIVEPLTGASVAYSNIETLVFRRFEASNRIAVGVDAGGPPIVTMYSSLTQAPIFQVMAFPANFLGGVRVATGDVTGDGVADLIAVPGSPGGPEVRVFDGVTGQLVRTFLAFDAVVGSGMNVAATDVDGDGFSDIVVALDVGAAPHVKVFSGRTNQEIRSFFAYGASFLGGVNLAAGDIDGDGRGDIITGTASGSAHVKVFSGRTRGETQSYFAYDPAFLGGVFVGTGDVNGDGVADLVTGAGLGAAAHVKAVSGVTGALLASFLDVDPTPVELQSGQYYPTGNPRTGPAGSALSPISAGSGARVSVGDTNDDLVREIIVTRGKSNLPAVRAYRPSGTLVTEFNAFAGASGFGVFVGANQ